MPVYNHSRVIPLFVFLHTGDDSLRAETCCFIVETYVHVLRCAIPVVRLNYMVRWIQTKKHNYKYG